MSDRFIFDEMACLPLLNQSLFAIDARKTVNLPSPFLMTALKQLALGLSKSPWSVLIPDDGSNSLATTHGLMQHSANTAEEIPSEPSSDGSTPKPSDSNDGSEGSSDSEIESETEDPVRDVVYHRMHHDGDSSMSLYIAANQALLGEIGQQHNETLSTIGNLTQRSGIVMAFNSVFMLELFRLDPDEGLVWWVSAISILISMMLGLITVVTGRMAPLGADIDIVKSTYENRMYEELTPIIFNERRIALNKSVRTEFRVSKLVLLQAVCLTVGVIGLLTMEVRR